MSADPKTAAAGYDIPALLEAFDWFNVMDYGIFLFCALMHLYCILNDKWLVSRVLTNC